jgi:hypothetical protein
LWKLFKQGNCQVLLKIICKYQDAVRQGMGEGNVLTTRRAKIKAVKKTKDKLQVKREKKGKFGKN